MKYLHTDSIPNGTKIVAIMHDGSGADLYEVTKEGDLYIPKYEETLTGAPDAYLLDCGYGYWMELPKSFKLWGKQ